MFTSRAEYRLHLREDNADLRLTEKGFELGVVPSQRFDAMRAKRDAVECETARLKSLWATPSNALGAALRAQRGIALAHEASALDLLRRPELEYAALTDTDGFGPAVVQEGVATQVEVQAKDAGDLDRKSTRLNSGDPSIA